jgi:hypothetical protein
MLIRVVRAVNDFILSARFSDKSLRGRVRLCVSRRFFMERGDSGEGLALSVVLTVSRPGFSPVLKDTLALALAFLRYFL